MQKKFSYNHVKSVFEEAGYTLLSKEYSHTHKKLDYLCPKGHKGSSSFNNFWRGRARCPIC